MCKRRTVIALACLAVHIGVAEGAGLIFKLPKDGSWAIYEGLLSQKADARGLAPKVDSTLKTTFYIASVGQVTINKQPCRWIEIQFDISVNTTDPASKETPKYAVIQRELSKVLIPEKYLVQGELPLDHFVRAWRSIHDSEPWLVTRRKDLDDSALGFLNARWREEDVTHLEKAEVESKLGKVACDGVEVTPTAPDAPTVKGSARLWFHPRSPFGLVSADWAAEGPGESGSWSLKLVDFGENATTKMPKTQLGPECHEKRGWPSRRSAKGVSLFSRPLRGVRILVRRPCRCRAI